MSSEYFLTKVIKWKSLSPTASSDVTRDVTIILQNDNGPCPLVALANTLILRESDNDDDTVPSNSSEGCSPSPRVIIPSLRSYTNGKEQVPVNGLLEIMAEILLSHDHGSGNGSGSGYNGDGFVTHPVNHDVDRVLVYLPKLVTGLNINIRFNGSFADGPEMALFRMYDIDPIHGWVCDPDYPEWTALQKVGSYDESQSILLKVEQEESKNNHGEQTINNEESSIPQSQETDLKTTAVAIKSFISEFPTQLTPYGLKFLQDLLDNRSLNVLFRNDHFSTTVMLNRKLYTLVTDSGYRDQPDIVWQSLTSISGNEDFFYDHNFNKTELSASLVEAKVQSSIEHHPDFLLARELQELEDSALASELASEQAVSDYKQRASRRSGNTRSSRAEPAPNTEANASSSSTPAYVKAKKVSRSPATTGGTKKSKDCIIM